MDGLLMSRLEQAADRLLEKNQSLAETCRCLEAEKSEWSEERRVLLAKIEDILIRLDDHFDQEES